MLSRKIIAAFVSGAFYAVLLGFISPNPFGETITSVPHYLFSSVSIVPVYMLYSIPVILIYGVTASIVSDKISELICGKIGDEKSEFLISAILHMLFGLILLLYGLGASLLFFMTDRLLRKYRKKYKWTQAMMSLAIPLAVWLTLMGVVWIKHLLEIR